MSTQNLLVERQADIVTITLNRPDQRNALSRTLMVELTGGCCSTLALATLEV